MGPEIQILFILSWLVLVKFLQVSLYPILRAPLGKLAYPVSYPAGVLLFTATSWYLGLLRLPVVLAAVPFLGLLAWSLTTGRYTCEDLKPHLSWDLIFLLAFFAMLSVRFVNPTITSAERFMDHAFIASIMRTPVVPPPDPWYAGGTLDMYYYGGYWMMGALGAVAGVPSQVVFNLALPTVFALAAVTLYAIGVLLVERFRWIPLLLLVLPNPAFFWNLLHGSAPFAVLWDSTRVIANTINEYSFFSFIWGDPHPHALAIFNQLFLSLVLLIALTRWHEGGRDLRIALIALATLSLGSMPVMNPWDVFVYGPVSILVSLLILRQGLGKGKKDLSALEFLLCVPVLSVLLYLPYYLEMATPGFLGIFPVTTPSDPWEFLLVHGFFFSIFLATGARDLARRPWLLVPSLLIAVAGYPSAALAAAAGTAVLARRDRSPEDLLALVGISLIIGTEFFYFKDYLGGIYYRMNTVFKFYTIAWILMGTSSLLIASRVLGKAGIPDSLSRRGIPVALAGLLVLLVVIPALLGVSFGHAGLTLDGLAYLERSNPGDAAALPFVRSLPQGTVIVEAVKGAYGYPSRVSAFTGVQTIIGWPSHEFMWRGADGRPYDRASDVRAIYEEPARAAGILERYHATYIYVGETERDLYTKLDLPKVGLVKVYDERGVSIYRFAG